MTTEYISEFNQLIADIKHYKMFNIKNRPFGRNGKELISEYQWFSFNPNGFNDRQKQEFIDKLMQEKLTTLEQLCTQNISAYLGQSSLDRINSIKSIREVDSHLFPNIARLQKLAQMSFDESNNLKLKQLREYLVSSLHPELQILFIDILLKPENEKIDVNFLANQIHEILESIPLNKVKNNVIYIGDLLVSAGILSSKVELELAIAKVHTAKQEDPIAANKLDRLKQELPALVKQQIPYSSIKKQAKFELTWDLLCNSLKEQVAKASQRPNSKLTDEKVKEVDEIFTRGKMDLIKHQEKVMQWLQSPAAYDVLKCKETWPIIKQIRNFILRTFGTLNDKSFDLSNHTMFASRTHEIALEIAEVALKKPK